MKWSGGILFILAGVCMLSACSVQKPQIVNDESAVPVKVVNVEETVLQKCLYYTGVITSEKIKKLGFKTGGIVERIYVQNGQAISKGQALALLDAKELRYGLEASEARLNTAREVYLFALDSFEKIGVLYNEGAVSRREYDSAEIELDIREAELKQAEVDYNNKKNMLEDMLLKSDIDGYVADVLLEEGEIVSPGYPVVVVGSDIQTVKVGLVEKDVSKVIPGMQAIINAKGVSSEGFVKNISKVPDSNTRTYQADITLDSGLYSPGCIADVKLMIGKQRGIWIPIGAVLSDGGSYVFVADGNIIKKRYIVLEEVYGDKVKVTGIEKGDKLVIENTSRVDEGSRINIVH